MAGLLNVLDLVLLAVALVMVKKLSTARSALPLPPGPRKFPLLGNLLDMPSSQEWLTFSEWGKKWGDIASVSMFGQNMVILNSADSAIDMLDNKSKIYSDRPVLQFGGELVGWKKTLVLAPYGTRFRNYRKYFHQTIGSYAAVSKFSSIEVEAHQFLKSLLANPEGFASHVRKTTGTTILRISHGYEVKTDNDPFVTIADIATEQFGLSTAPGGFLVNLVPALRHIPAWFPGAGFHKTAKEWAETLEEMAEGPHQFVKSQMAAGVAEPSFTSRLLSQPGMTEEQEYEIKWSAASLYSGGADTTVASINAFFLAMALHPESMIKAQQEIDSVVGNQRLPTFEDRANLPYVNALVKELFRWHSVVPTEDNIHNGYFIPKGSLVLPNIWWMTHNPDVYPDPLKFKPERFLGPCPERDPTEICFGFGRRICPGRVLADASVFMSISRTLAVYNISPAQKNGLPVKPIHEQMTGTISHPRPFECCITPRSQEAVQLINS